MGHEKETHQEREKEQNQKVDYYLKHGHIIVDKDGNELMIKPRDGLSQEKGNCK